MCDSPLCVSAVVGPNLNPGGVVAISSKKNPLCVCMCMCVRMCRGPVCVTRHIYKLKTKCMIWKKYFIIFSSNIFNQLGIL